MVPKEHVRVRRDWDRFLTFCKAVAICRSFQSSPRLPQNLIVDFSDYCVTYRVLNAALASTTYALHEREIALAESVRAIQKKNGRPVTIQEIATHLAWSEALVYKYVDPAIAHGLLRKIPGSRQSNQKLLEWVAGSETGFLPSPVRVLRKLKGTKLEARFIDPLTANRRKLWPSRLVPLSSIQTR